VLGKELFLGGLFPIISTDFKSALNSAYFEYSYAKKERKNFWGHWVYTVYEFLLEPVKCKFVRNGLTNWKTFLTNFFENIIWHLFAGESD
jgi:hypothetical protein